MGDKTLAKVENQPDVEATPLAPDSTAGHPKDNAQDRHAQDPGATHTPGEPQEADPAWQGVPL